MPWVNREPKDSSTDLDQQLKSILENPKITPPTRKFTTLIRKKIEQYATVRVGSKTDKTEKKKLGEEISDLAKHAQSRRKKRSLFTQFKPMGRFSQIGKECCKTA